MFWIQEHFQLNQFKTLHYDHFNIFQVYVDASPSCNTLAFQLGQTAIGTTIPVRTWSLKVRKNNFNTILIENSYNEFKFQFLGYDLLFYDIKCLKQNLENVWA